MSGFDIQKKDITARTGEVTTPSPSLSPAGEAPVQKPKGPSIFTKNEQNVTASSNEPIPVANPDSTSAEIDNELNTTNLDLYDNTSTVQQAERQKTPERLQLEKDYAQYAKEHNFSESYPFEDFINELYEKDLLNEDEKKFIERFEASDQTIKQENMGTAPEIEVTPETKERLSKYDDILKDNNPGMTPYVKNSQIMDLYLSKHDEIYQHLNTDKAKQRYRDSIIHDFMKYILPGEKTSAQRKIAQLDIAKIFIDCDAKGDNPLELKAKGPKVINARVASINQTVAQKITAVYNQLDIKNLDLDKMKPDEAMFTIGKKIALLTDPKFEEKYPTEEAQQKFILDKVKRMLKQALSIEYSDNNKDIIYEIGLSMYKDVLQSSGANIGQALLELNRSTPKQNELIARTLKDHPEIIEKATPEDKQILNELKTRSEIYLDILGKDNKTKITENDIYNELKSLKEAGKLSPEQESLYEFYLKMDKICSGDSKLKEHIFAKEARFDSFIAKCALSKMQPVQYIEAQLVDKEGNPLTGKAALLEKYIDLIKAAKIDDNFEHIGFILLSMKRHGFSEEEVNTHTGKLLDETFAIRNIARGRTKDVTDGANYLAAHSTNDQQINAYGSAMQKSVKVMDNNSVCSILSNLETNTYDNYIASGVNLYKSAQDAINITTDFINNENVADTRKSSYTRSLVVTCTDPQRQLTYSNELSQLDNKAVNEGLAAAEPYVDNSVRSQYSRNIDNSVARMEQSGKYSSEEIAQMKKDIQQARETGMTKAETAQAKKTQQEVKTATQKAQQQQKAEQKAQKEALEQKQQTVLTHAKTVIATATASKPKASTSTATSSHTQAIEDAQKSLNQTLERLIKAQTVAETERVRQELLNRIEQFQAQVRLSQEERDLRIQLSEREAVNALLAESAAEEAQESTDAEEAVAVAADTEVSAEDGATAEVRSQAEKSGLSTEAVQELHEAYKSGGLVALYDKASTIVGSKAQERLLNYISHTSSSTLHSFADAHSGNKNILMTLFRNSKDPYVMQLLIRNGYASEVLGSGAITVKDFLSYASPTTVTNWLTDLQKTGATYTLKEAFANIGNASSGNASALQPGSDAWLKAQRTSMAAASSEQTDNLSQTDPARTASASVSSNGLFEEYEGLALGSDRVRMGIPVDKRVDKRFFRMG